MSDKRGRAARAYIETECSISGNVDIAPITEPVKPYTLNSFSLEDWHIENGWPVPGIGESVPIDAYDITPDPVTLPAPEEITTNAHVRWIGRDFNGSTWTPLQGTGNWTGTANTKASYSYKTGGYSYAHPAVRFDQDNGEYLTADLTAVSGTRYSIVMVFKPYSAESPDVEDDEVATYGLWAPSTEATGQPELRVRNDKIYFKTSPELPVRQPHTYADRSFAHYIHRSAPSYLVFSVGANYLRLYLGDGPSSLESYRLNDPHDLNKVFNFRLGSYAADTTHTADMLVFDLGFYPEVMGEIQVVDEVTTLAAAYGGK